MIKLRANEHSKALHTSSCKCLHWLRPMLQEKQWLGEGSLLYAMWSQLRPHLRSWPSIFRCLTVDCAIFSMTFDPFVPHMLWMQATTIWHLSTGHITRSDPSFSDTGSELKSHEVRLSLEESWDEIWMWLEVDLPSLMHKIIYFSR